MFPDLCPSDFEPSKRKRSDGDRTNGSGLDGKRAKDPMNGIRAAILRCLDVITGETNNDFKNQRDLRRYADLCGAHQHGVSAAGGQ